MELKIKSDLTLVYRTPSYVGASMRCIEGFKKEMRDKNYGKEESLDAWLWYFTGWRDGMTTLLLAAKDMK